jgi:hypothetical protein
MARAVPDRRLMRSALELVGRCMEVFPGLRVVHGRQPDQPTRPATP